MEPVKTVFPELLTLTAVQLFALTPYLIVMAGATVATLLCTLKTVSAKWAVLWTSALTCLLAIGASVRCWISLGAKVAAFDGALVVDTYSMFFNVVYLAIALITIISSIKYLDDEGIQYPEYNVLILFSVLGMMLMSTATDLLVFFISLELMSLMVYSLVCFRRHDRKCNEASIKYFIMGAAASAVLLYGTALLYGFTGTTHIDAILEYAKSPGGQSTLLFPVAVLLVVIGFLFKVASAPFHMWMPDVYEGAPVPITGFMTTALKASAFAAFVRVFSTTGYGEGLSAIFQKQFHDLLWVSAALTMIVGNLVALTQTNLKRMLAYSSIAHTGYLLVGLMVGGATEMGYAPTVLYLVTYSVMNLGAFSILTVLSSKGDGNLMLHDLSGLAKRSPLTALAMALFMFSMAGIPPSGGFIGKYWLFYSAILAHEVPLVILAVLCSAVSVYFYLRVVVYMYMRDGSLVVEPRQKWSYSAAIAVWLLVLGSMQLGFVPAKVLELAKQAAQAL